MQVHRQSDAHLGEGVFEQRFSDDRMRMIMRNRQT
jgi:hypothetical protein